MNQSNSLSPIPTTPSQQLAYNLPAGSVPAAAAAFSGRPRFSLPAIFISFISSLSAPEIWFDGCRCR